MIESEIADAELGALIIRIHLTTGQIREHIYPVAKAAIIRPTLLTGRRKSHY